MSILPQHKETRAQEIYLMTVFHTRSMNSPCLESKPLSEESLKQEPCYVVLVTCQTIESAEKISRCLVEEKLAACVNRFSPMVSTYWWEGQIEIAEEILLMIKTTQAALPLLCQRIEAIHNYAVPEVIALPIFAASSKYLSWLVQSVHG